MRLFFTSVILLLVLFLALRRGGEPERYVAIALVLALGVSVTNRLVFGNPTFRGFQPILFTLECGSLVSFGFIALLANRVWPLWVAALQLLVVVAHIAKLVGIGGLAGVYWAMTTVPSYLQVVVLLIGIGAHTRRIKSVGDYLDWR
jgi:peptidoglycan/LPS O-acetylase OafA/YrhL